jgi:hypothetical protein
MPIEFDDAYEGEVRAREERYRKARAALIVPATLLILAGALGLLSTALTLARLDTMPQELDQLIDKVENDQTLNREDKDFQIHLLNFARDSSEKPYMQYVYFGILALSGIVVVGGIRMMQVSGPALPSIAAALVMTPCTTSCCCIFGIPVGIFAIAVLNRPYVRIAMAERRGALINRDDYESQ